MELETMGWISLLPAIIAIVLSFATKNTIVALLVACFVGTLVSGQGLLGLPTIIKEACGTTSFSWVMLLNLYIAIIVAFFHKTGAIQAFSDWVHSKNLSRKGTQLVAWVLGIFVYFSDSFSPLFVGTVMRDISDRAKISKEKLSYIADSTAAPVSVLVPVTGWAAYLMSLAVGVGCIVTQDDAQALFLKAIPMNFYPLFAVILVGLIASGIVKDFGPMKKAEERAMSGGPLAPPGSEKIDLNAGDVELKAKPRLWNLIVPVVGMVFFTIIFDLDMQYGVIATMALCFVLFVGQKLVTAEEFWDYSIEGIKNMILPLALMVLAYIFAAVNDQVGFTRFVIDVAVEHASPQMLPVLIFALLAVTEFITGTNWGMYIIALPIVIPICMGAGIPVALGCGAVISAGVLGSHCCFYSDCTVITSSATGCDNFAHAWTQMPFGLLAGVVAAIGYLIAGIAMV